jgi:hypothetical protein
METYKMEGENTQTDGKPEIDIEKTWHEQGYSATVDGRTYWFSICDATGTSDFLCQTDDISEEQQKSDREAILLKI